MIEVALFKSPIKSKKYRINFYKNGQYWKKVDFGAQGMSDFTIHKDTERRTRYLDRHRHRENWDNPYTAGAASRWILWNKPTLQESWQDYVRRFNFKIMSS